MGKVEKAKLKEANEHAVEDATIKIWLKEQIADITGGATGIILSPFNENDRLAPSVLKKAYEESSSSGMFNRNLEKEAKEALNGVITDEYCAMFEELKVRLNNESSQMQSAFHRNFDKMSITEIFKAGGLTDGITIDLYEYLNRDYQLDLMFQTYHESVTLSSFISAIGKPLEEVKAIYRNETEKFNSDANNALSLLVVQQGYGIDALFNPEIEAESKFIASIKREAISWDEKGRILTALATFNGNDFVSFISDCLDCNGNENKCVILPQDTVIGLFNPLIGIGSHMGIALDKPAEIPPNMLKNILFEGSSNSRFYTVGETLNLDIGTDNWKRGTKLDKSSVFPIALEGATFKSAKLAYDNIIQGEKKQTIKKKVASSSIER